MIVALVRTRSGGPPWAARANPGVASRAKLGANAAPAAAPMAVLSTVRRVIYALRMLLHPPDLIAARTRIILRGASPERQQRAHDAYTSSQVQQGTDPSWYKTVRGG